MLQISIPHYTHRIFCFLIFGLAIQYVIIYIIWNYFCQCHGDSGRVAKKITCILRDFEPETTDLPNIVRQLSASKDVSSILVVSDRTLYPPVILKDDKVSFVEIEQSISPAKPRKNFEELIKTEWILVVPDMISVNLAAAHFVDLIKHAEHDLLTSDIRIWSVRVKGKRVSCHSVFYDHKFWTLQVNSSSGPVCDGITGSAVYFLRTKDFLTLTEPFAQPMDESLLIQGSLRGWKAKALEGANTPFSRGAKMLDPLILTKRRDERDGLIKKLYERMGVKKRVINGVEEIYGCSKTTPRCFGTIINEVPNYIYEGRFTPPCCIRALKLTLAHVMEVFSTNSVRYWLEGGSLLGAARNGQLIPWDYDVDLGVYQNETNRVQYLQAALQGPVQDPQGFVWEMAPAEESGSKVAGIGFFRVHFSRHNRNHVDIFPFYVNNSLITKDYWFPAHPQDKPFPEHFLTPMETIDFMGLTVSSPNNITQFLELKFGAGCIENPKYPPGFH